MQIVEPLSTKGPGTFDYDKIGVRGGEKNVKIRLFVLERMFGSLSGLGTVFVELVLLSVVTFIGALLSMAYYTLFERKFLACAQRRKGPRKVGLAGLAQPFADALKLFFKQRVTPSRANRIGFTVAPATMLSLAFIL